MQLLNASLPIVPADAENIAHAADMLRKGRLVAFPTETVYGLGADAESDDAVASIYHTKGRPSHNPLIVHVASSQMALRYADVTADAMALMEQFWPGPLTLVLPLVSNTLSSLVLAGGNTVALRCPDHPVAHSLLHAFGSGIAAPSANRSGKISPTQAGHVYEEFHSQPESMVMILDGGASLVGLESTVLDLSGANPQLLRHGSITAQQLHIHDQIAQSDEIVLKSPGMLSSHYAPNAPVRLHAHHVEATEALLAFGDIAHISGAGEAVACRNLSEAGNLDEAAQNLYHMMRALDQSSADGIAVMAVPNRGIGRAINDRLQRAAAKKHDKAG